MIELHGRIAVVTGGGSGLGRASASALQAAGARVVLLDRDAHALAAAADTPGLRGYVCDITQDLETEQLFERIRDEVGPVSILVNCAGIADPGSVVRQGQAMPLSRFEQV
ncbi:MAG: SDR family NAD(P)-dependent oxidoreductase, partial [Comamonas sp.]